jgi:hypothetical protein
MDGGGGATCRVQTFPPRGSQGAPRWEWKLEGVEGLSL